MSDPTLQDQIATVLRIEAQLMGRWTVQKVPVQYMGRNPDKFNHAGRPDSPDVVPVLKAERLRNLR
jgi:hypothetical protein